ncbi:hypothetical protein BH10BAC5_BH10BAC5_07740 [soil metagenome]
MSSRVTYSVILFLSFLWCACILLAPYLIDMGGIYSKFSSGIYYFYSSYCHQIRDRSFLLGNNPYGVCSRCTSIYFAFLAGVLAYPFIYRINNTILPKVYPLIVAGAFVVADVFFDLFSGIYSNSFITRSVTGGMLGIVLPFYLIPGFVKITGDIEAALTKNKSKKVCSQID